MAAMTLIDLGPIAQKLGLPVGGVDAVVRLLDEGNTVPFLTRYRRDEPAPVLPLRDEPDLLSWLETSGRLVADEETASTDVSTVEEEELSALMGEKEDYNQNDEQAEEDWED
jgi:transcriptional accessory protein Tex/SPT6